MNSQSILHKRNKLLVNIIWGMLVLGIAVDLLTGAGSDSILVLAVVGFITCGVATLLTYRRWLEEYVMYIISAIVTALTLLLIYTGPVITTYLLIYVNLAIMTLYGSFRALAFSTLMGVGVTVYLFASPYKSDVFGDNDIITIFLYLAMIAAPLLASSRFSERLQRDASDQHEKAVEAKNRAEALVADVSASLLLLNDFSSRLKENVEATGGISREVTLAFGEVAASNQTQAASIADIGDSARAIEAAVSSLLERSGEMRSISESSAERTRTGRTDADALEEDMGRLHETTEATVALMRQLGEQSERIGDILATIKRISSQTNILALNAAIEAQRAGEHGKGFAVVSDEVRKLATASQQSTEQIESILEGIRAKTELAAEQVEGGRRTVVQSRETVRRVSDVLRATAEDSGRIERQSAEVNRSADELQRQYGNIADRIETIAAISEENMASVEEMSASMQTQDDRIAEVVDSFLQLDKLASDLNKMTRR